MSTITIEEAQARLPQLIDQAKPGDELIITRDQKPVATLTVIAPTIRKPRQPGTLKGTVLYMAPDFAAPLEEFKEYMP
jgi:antitoxin (DNA-binding transcriptional repressor) of toxin-antitoxin stability system